jgi:hypothetical protein
LKKLRLNGGNYEEEEERSHPEENKLEDAKRTSKEKDYLKKLRVNGSSDDEERRSGSEEKKFEVPTVTSKEPVKVFKCHLCEFSDSIKTNHLVHLAKDHFKEDLKIYFGKDLGECLLCSKVMLDESCLLQHLAVTHNVLDGFIVGQKLDKNGHSLDKNGHSLEKNGHSLDKNGHSLYKNGHSLDKNGHSLEHNGHSLDKNGHTLHKNVQNGQQLEQNGQNLDKNGQKSDNNVTDEKEKIGKHNNKHTAEEEQQDKRTEKKDSKGFKCHLCDFECLTSLSILRHIGTKHFKEKVDEFVDKEKQWDCSICGKHFELKGILITHIVSHHRLLSSYIPSVDALKVK